MSKRHDSEPWVYTVGLLPHRVAAYEDVARKGVVYLRWRVEKRPARVHTAKRSDEKDWKRKSLGFTVRDAKGRIDREAAQRAQQAADAQYQLLCAGGVIPATPKAELTIAEGWTLACDPERGRWNVPSPHREEMERCLNRAKSIWGADTPWNAIDRGLLRKLWRTELKRLRANGHDGVRGTEVLVARVLALASWLRDEQVIAPTACLPWKAMREEMAKDFVRPARDGDAPREVMVRRLRYTLEEFRLLLEHCAAADPRWGLVYTMGAEYRIGQVKRCRRSQLDLTRGTLRFAGSGKKRGTVVKLTPAQLAMMQGALTSGYLAGLEAAYLAQEIDDYALFLGGHLPTKDGALYTRADHATRAPVDDSAMRTWHRRTEQLAGIPHVTGRGWYGARRTGVDEAKKRGLSRDGMRKWGSWSDNQVPDAIYAEQEQEWAVDEAAEMRALVRGEIVESIDQNGASPNTGVPGLADHQQDK